MAPPNSEKKIIYNSYWAAVLTAATISGLLTAMGIYWMETYGMALFILIPFFIGLCSTAIYGYKAGITTRKAWVLGVTALAIYSFMLMLFAIEGLICIVMSLPLAIPIAILGSLVGQALIKRTITGAGGATLVLLFLIPLTGFVEKTVAPSLTSVSTSVEISAAPETVWKNVVEFPQLQEPTEFIFKTGIAYPINATIKGTGKGAVRYCNFTTGSFVEPITVWDEPKLLQFDVEQQPEPMKEISFWDVDAPHLHDYFISKRGQFKLVALPNGNTLLEGTTWYSHNIKPEFYWQLWSEHIVHKIHNRVLLHIKKQSEKE